MMLPLNQGDIRYVTLWIPLILGVKGLRKAVAVTKYMLRINLGIQLQLHVKATARKCIEILGKWLTLCDVINLLHLSYKLFYANLVSHLSVNDLKMKAK